MAKRQKKIKGSTASTRWRSRVQVTLPEPFKRTPFTAQVVEIPEEYEIIPAVEWVGLRPRMYRVAVRKSPDSGDFPVTKKRTRKSA